MKIQSRNGGGGGTFGNYKPPLRRGSCRDKSVGWSKSAEKNILLPRKRTVRVRNVT